MYMLTPKELSDLIGFDDVDRVAQIMKATLASLSYIKIDGEVRVEGMVFTKISPHQLTMKIDILPKELADALEGQDLIQLPV